MTAPHRRFACPGLSTPMQTGDGLLVRFLTTAPIPLDAFSALSDAAQVHGNGIIEITVRGSVQVRGLSPLSAPAFADTLASLAIEASDGVPIIADPLPDDDAALIDANGLAAALRRAIAEKALPLAPKVSVLVDGGGRIDLDALAADIRLRAVANPEGTRLHILAAGDARSAIPLAVVPTEEAVEFALALLTVIAAQGSLARAGDALRSRANSELAPVPLEPRASAIGLHRLKAGFALGVGLAFGHAEAQALAALAKIAASNGAGWARPAPDRALLFGPLDGAAANAMAREAERLGFVVEAGDPRRRIVACPGAPSCASGLISARALAAAIARDVPPPEGEGLALHVSGCAKGCAQSAAAPLTLVGTERGCGVIGNGTARDAPVTYLDPREIIAALIRMGSKSKRAVHA
jgi:precorrin-3B synthase